MEAYGVNQNWGLAGHFVPFLQPPQFCFHCIEIITVGLLDLVNISHSAKYYDFTIEKTTSAPDVNVSNLSRSL
jgi:hypothetical protein